MGGCNFQKGVYSSMFLTIYFRCIDNFLIYFLHLDPDKVNPRTVWKQLYSRSSGLSMVTP